MEMCCFRFQLVLHLRWRRYSMPFLTQRVPVSLECSMTGLVQRWGMSCTLTTICDENDFCLFFFWIRISVKDCATTSRNSPTRMPPLVWELQSCDCHVTWVISFTMFHFQRTFGLTLVKLAVTLSLMSCPHGPSRWDIQCSLSMENKWVVISFEARGELYELTLFVCLRMVTRECSLSPRRSSVLMET